MHSKGGWHFAPHTRKHEGRRFPDVALAVASQVLRLELVATARACRGVATLPALRPHVHGEVLAWRQGRDAQDVARYSPRGKDVNSKFPAQHIASEVELVSNGAVNWNEVCFIQFLCVESTQCANIVSIAE